MATQESPNELLRASPDTIFLVSADMPGCGSSTLSQSLAEQLEATRGSDVFLCSVGKMVREALEVTNEQELQDKLAEVKEPHVFTPKIYREMLPSSGFCVVDGKLATTAAPRYIPQERPIVSIELTAPPLFSAKRILQREKGVTVSELFGEDPDHSIIDFLAQVRNRSIQEARLKQELINSGPPDSGAHGDDDSNITKISIDTSTRSKEEVLAQITGENGHEEKAPEWEVTALKNTLKTLMSLGVDLRPDMHAQDRVHFEHQLEAITYSIDRLGITLNSAGLTVIRDDLKKAIIDCWYGLMMKRIPRFFDHITKEDGPSELVFDTESHSWSPEFYKIAEGWPTLSALFKDKTLVDPFAGSGTLLNLLVARGIPKRAIYSDMSFVGGVSLNGSNYWYNPRLNAQASQLLFDDLPSWYKPDFSSVGGYLTSDARALSLDDNSVDFVFGDPPYGKNLDGAGIGVLFGCLKEFNRVAREGSVLLVPTSWLKELKAAGKPIKQLTGDVSGGKSNFPVCYILVSKF